MDPINAVAGGTRPVGPRRRRAGDRRQLTRASARAGSATPPRSASIRRRTSAGSATPGWSPPTTPTSPRESPGSAFTGWSRSTTITRSDSTRGSTRSRRPCSGSSSATSTPGPRAAARPPTATADLFDDQGLTDRVVLPEGRPGHFHVYNQFVVRVPAAGPRRAPRPPGGPPRSGPRSITRSRSTFRPASPRSATSPATSRVAEAAAARDPRPADVPRADRGRPAPRRQLDRPILPGPRLAAPGSGRAA